MKLKVALSAVFAAILFAASPFVEAIPLTPGPHRIELTARRFQLLLGEITLKKDQPVVLVLKCVDVPHGIGFKEVDIETKASKGQISELSFTPDKAGTFVGHRTVFCAAGHGSMTLALHVGD